jgi:hypothetical protein
VGQTDESWKLARLADQGIEHCGSVDRAVDAHSYQRRGRQAALGRVRHHSADREGHAVRLGYPGYDVRFHICYACAGRLVCSPLFRWTAERRIDTAYVDDFRVGNELGEPRRPTSVCSDACGSVDHGAGDEPCPWPKPRNKTAGDAETQDRPAPFRDGTLEVGFEALGLTAARERFYARTSGDPGLCG